MRLPLLLIIISALILTACEPQIGGSQTPVECRADSECRTGGCSGIVCEPADAEPLFTTCEWKEEYSCYKIIECGCIDNRCDWKKTPEFDECINEKSGQEIIH